LSLNRDSTDFEAGDIVLFSAEFNKNIDWEITITGEESGAVKRIEGFSRVVDSNNARWTGGVTDLPFFKEEKCMVELRVPEEPDFLNTDSIVIQSTRVYDGNLMTDFEDDPGGNIVVRNFEFEFDLPRTGRRDNVMPAAQGDWVLALTGTDGVVDNFFVGLIEVKSAIQGTPYMPMPSNVPGNVYFNCFLYNDGRPHGIAIIDLVFDSNNNGDLDASDQLFASGDIPLTWTGWRSFNRTLEDFGLTEAQLEGIVGIRAVLISDNNSQPTPREEVQFGLDFVTFTAGSPLEL
jgi:hypothetical protein